MLQRILNDRPCESSASTWMSCWKLYAWIWWNIALIVSLKRPLICSKSFAIRATKERCSCSEWGLEVAKFHRTPTELETERKDRLGLGLVVRCDLSCIVELVLAVIAGSSWVTPFNAAIRKDRLKPEVSRFMRWGADKESSLCERVVFPLQDDDTIGSKGCWI